MFPNILANNSEDDNFCNAAYNKNIECVIPNSELILNIRTGGVSTKKKCFVCAEKIDFKGLIQLRITEQSDNRKMYTSTVDSSSFHELKQDQSLHVTFSGFVENLIKIIQDCQRGVLEVDLVQSRDNQLILQFYEMRSFKNLIHLCLPAKVAPLNVVLFYMNNVLNNLQKVNASHENAMKCMQHELDSHLGRLSQLELENSKLRESLLENSKAVAIRHQEEIHQMQESLRRASEHRQAENERHMKAMATLQAQLDRALHEKSNVTAEKCQETKKWEHLREEMASLKTTLASVREQNEKLVADMAAIKNLDRKNEMHLADSRNHIHELQDKIKKYDKVKSDLIAELEAEKNICATKRQALEMATEEISKANQIIAKQAQELTKLRKTVGWRTEIALQQEKAIQEMDRQLTKRCRQVESLEKTIDGLRTDIPLQLESMKKFANAIETKYSEKISALTQKLSLMDSESHVPGRRTIR